MHSPCPAVSGHVCSSPSAVPVLAPPMNNCLGSAKVRRRLPFLGSRRRLPCLEFQSSGELPRWRLLPGAVRLARWRLPVASSGCRALASSGSRVLLVACSGSIAAAHEGSPRAGPPPLVPEGSRLAGSSSYDDDVGNTLHSQRAPPLHDRELPASLNRAPPEPLQPRRAESTPPSGPPPQPPCQSWNGSYVFKW